MNQQNVSAENPFGVPNKPGKWRSAWDIEKFGVEQYYLYSLLKIEDAKNTC